MQKTAENALFLRSDLTVQDRILEIRSLASLGIHAFLSLPKLCLANWSLEMP